MINKVFHYSTLTLSSLVMTLFVLEGIVRIFLPQQLILLRPDIWIPDDTFGWRHAPNIDKRINTGERRVRFITDGQGHRIGVRNRPKGDINILALGDSFLAALQVEYEQTMAALLERHLSNQLKYKVRVINTGVGGWGPNHYLLEARRELKRFRYDLVLVFLFLGNDISARRHEKFKARKPVITHKLRAPKSFSFSEFVYTIAYPANDFLERRSHLYVLIKDRAWFLLMKIGLSARYFPDGLLRSQADSPMWDMTASVCCEIDDLANALDIPVLFVLIPGAYQVESDLAHRYAQALGIDRKDIDMDQPARLLKDKFTLYRLNILDTTEMLKAAHNAGKHNIFGKIDTHLGPAGHKLVADFIAPTVAELVKKVF